MPADSQQMQVERNEDGQFIKGQSGNSVGREKGSRNRATMLVEHLRTAAERRLTDTDTRMLEAAVAEDEQASVPFAWAEGAGV